MKKVSDVLNQLAERVCFLALAAMVVVITLQVICRLYFSALGWSEELGRYLLVWITFLGATIGFKRGSHMAVTALVTLLRPATRAFFQKLVTLLCLAFFFLVSIYGVRLMQLQCAQTSPSLNIPMSAVYAVLPISGVLALIHFMANLFEGSGKL
ncbi:MAG TPA: TRAP transporter small permease [Firmicutes bacterium]|nr:TRAP transporter small permease [Bacillota bacterium]